MRKIFTIMAATVISFCFSVPAFAETTPPQNLDMNQFKLEWADEFNGDELDTSIWNYDIGWRNNGWGNAELEYYTDSKENVYVSDGTLKVVAKAEDKDAQHFTSGRINTSGKKEVGYGYCEARIKLPSVNGLWPAFWMLGANEPMGWPYCGEIDILESWNTRDFAQNCFHYADDDSPYYATEGWKSDNYNNNKNTDMFLKSWGLSAWNKTEWHTYGVLKTDKYLTFYYDGRRASAYIDITKPKMSEAHNNYYFIINLACGGNLTGNVMPSSADLPSQMEVDYVRYYSQIPEQETSSSKTVKKPAKATIKALKNVAKKKVKVTIKKISGVKGYQIRWSTYKNFKKYQDKTTAKTTFVIKGLPAKKKCFVKVRAFVKDGSKNKYGNWSIVKKVKINK